MNTFRTVTAAFVMIAGIAAANAASAYERWIDVHNVGDSDVVAVQISDIGRNTWGPDVLDDVILVGDVGEVEPDATRGYCRFDMRLTYEDGTASDIYDVNLCEATDIVTDGKSYDLYTL